MVVRNVESASPALLRQDPPSLIGGLPCLDFVNTVRWRGDPEARWERLTDYGELAHWAAGGRPAWPGARPGGCWPRPSARQAKRSAVRQAALALREALARLFTAPTAPSPEAAIWRWSTASWRRPRRA